MTLYSLKKLKCFEKEQTHRIHRMYKQYKKLYDTHFFIIHFLHYPLVYSFRIRYKNF